MKNYKYLLTYTYIFIYIPATCRSTNVVVLLGAFINSALCSYSFKPDNISTYLIFSRVMKSAHNCTLVSWWSFLGIPGKSSKCHLFIQTDRQTDRWAVSLRPFVLILNILNFVFVSTFILNISHSAKNSTFKKYKRQNIYWAINQVWNTFQQQKSIFLIAHVFAVDLHTHEYTGSHTAGCARAMSAGPAQQHETHF